MSIADTITPGDRIRLKPVEVIKVHNDYISVRLFSVTAARIEYCDIEEVVPRPLAPGDRVQANLEIVQIDGDTAWCKEAPWPLYCQPAHGRPQHDRADRRSYQHPSVSQAPPCYPYPLDTLTRVKFVGDQGS